MRLNNVFSTESQISSNLTWCLNLAEKYSKTYPNMHVWMILQTMKSCVRISCEQCAAAEKWEVSRFWTGVKKEIPEPFTLTQKLISKPSNTWEVFNPQSSKLDWSFKVQHQDPRRSHRRQRRPQRHPRGGRQLWFPTQQVLIQWCPFGPRPLRSWRVKQQKILSYNTALYKFDTSATISITIALQCLMHIWSFL